MRPLLEIRLCMPVSGALAESIRLSFNRTYWVLLRGRGDARVSVSCLVSRMMSLPAAGLPSHHH